MLICGAAVDFDDVGMVQKGLDFDLSDELVDAGLVELVFPDRLQAENHSGRKVLDEVHAPKASRINIFYYLKNFNAAAKVEDFELFLLHRCPPRLS